MDKTETREMTQKIQVREDEEGKRTISGYAVKWGKKSHVLGYFRKFREQFQKGAFADSLQKDDQRFLWSHDKSKVLGRTKNGTLRLLEDDIGLYFELDLPDTTLGEDAYKSIKRGDVDGVSFGFQMINHDLEEPDDDLPIRTVTKARLLEVSIVAFPAYPDSEVNARGYDPIKHWEQELKQEERRKRLILQTLL